MCRSSILPKSGKQEQRVRNGAGMHNMSWLKDHVVAHQFGEGVDLSQLKSCTLSKWLAAAAASAAGGRPSSAR